MSINLLTYISQTVYTGSPKTPPTGRTLKSNPITLVDISAMRADFCIKFYTTLKR